MLTVRTAQREGQAETPQLAAIERDVHGLLGRLAIVGVDRHEVHIAGFHLDAARDAIRRLTAAAA